MSRRMTSSSASEYTNPPPRGRTITNRGMRTAAFTAAIIPALGVVPPSYRLSHSSRRPAPPRSAATADSTESTQASTSIGTISRALVGAGNVARAVVRSRKPRHVVTGSIDLVALATRQAFVEQRDVTLPLDANPRCVGHPGDSRLSLLDRD